VESSVVIADINRQQVTGKISVTMSDNIHTISKSAGLNTGDNDIKQLSEELQLFLKIRPYILKCLALNHDVNNPLAGIIGYGELLMYDKSLTAEQKAHIEQIMLCAERIRTEVNELCEAKIALQGKVDLRHVVELFSKNSIG
jgi:signal transduction histidine kinase